MTHRFVAIVSAFASFAFASSAHAYCRTTTTTGVPAGSCQTSGNPLYIPSACVGYHIQNKNSPNVPNTVLSDALANAFAAWVAPNEVCRPGISVLELAPTDEAPNAPFTVNGPHANVVGVVDANWPHADSASENLALVTVTFDKTTGEMLDIDMEINAAEHKFYWQGSPNSGNPEAYDLQTMIDHEAGHFLGIAHSEDMNAIMYSFLPPATSKSLDADDHMAICAAYPNRQTRITASGPLAATACDLGGNGTGSACTPLIGHGCAAIAPPPKNDGSTAAGMGALALVAGAVLRGRSRRARRR
jgi:hypothetical protein